MAKFYVAESFRIPLDAPVVRLAPGAVYLAGDEITGLTAPEARELLALAPEGAFQAIDEEADSVIEYMATHAVEINRRVDLSGDFTQEKDE